METCFALTKLFIHMDDLVVFKLDFGYKTLVALITGQRFSASDDNSYVLAVVTFTWPIFLSLHMCDLTSSSSEKVLLGGSRV